MNLAAFQAHIANRDQNQVSGEQSNPQVLQSYIGARDDRGGQGRGRSS